MDASKGPFTSPENLAQRRGGGRVTIKDLARELGLSIGAVSQALNPRESTIKLRPETAERVRAMARKMNYRPHAGASSIRSRYTRNMGYFAVKHSLLGFEPNAYQAGLHDEALEHNFRITLVRVHTEPQHQEVPRVFRETHLDALIIMNFAALTASYRELVREAGLPVVVLNDRQATNAVYVDDLVGGRMAAAHLLEMGYRKVSFLHLSGAPNLQTETLHYSVLDRMEGYRQVMVEAGLPPDIRRLPLHDEGHAVAEWYRSQRPEAVFCYSDQIANALLRFLYRMDVRVPHDVAVMGYDDNFEATQAVVPLSTIHVPSYEMARAAFRMALQLAESDPNGTLPAEVFRPTVVSRTSSRPPV